MKFGGTVHASMPKVSPTIKRRPSSKDTNHSGLGCHSGVSRTTVMSFQFVAITEVVLKQSCSACFNQRRRPLENGCYPLKSWYRVFVRGRIVSKIVSAIRAPNIDIPLCHQPRSNRCVFIDKLCIHKSCIVHLDISSSTNYQKFRFWLSVQSILLVIAWLYCSQVSSPCRWWYLQLPKTLLAYSFKVYLFNSVQ